VIYHDFLASEDRNNLKQKDKLLYEYNFSEIEAIFSIRQHILIRITGMLMSNTPTKIDFGDKNGIVPQEKLSSFVEMMFAKSKDLIANFNGGIFAVN
jgi:hypothetical protein